MRQRRHNRTAGFSLIEVVVGIALLGLVSAPICASLVLSVRLNSHAQALMHARLQTAGVVETLLAEGIAEGTANGDLEMEDLPEGVSVAVTREGAFYDVTVTGSVGAAGKEQTVVVETSVRSVPAEGGAP